MIFVAVEVSPVRSKPPAAVGDCISNDGRHDLGAAALFSTRTSGRFGFHTEISRVGLRVEINRVAEQLSPCIA